VASIILRARKPELFELISKIDGKSFSEKAWKWSHNALGGQCNHCQKPTKYLDFGRAYAKFCSTRCTANSAQVTAKKETANIIKYGVKHYSSTNEFKQKFQSTCIAKYGVANPGQIIEKMSQRSRQKQLTFYTYIISKVSEFAIPKFDFDDYTHVRDKELEWECTGCHNSFSSSLFGRLPKCTVCFPPTAPGGQSSIEKDVIAEVRKFYSGEIIENSRKIIPPKEIDIYFPIEKFAIEINGIYWHSNDRLSSNYHYEKFKMCNSAGITLLMITDDEWTNHKELVCAMIKHRLKLTTQTIFARKCTVREIESSVAKHFLEQTHIHGYSKASAHFGLFHHDQLCAVLSCMKKNRFSNSAHVVEIVRLSFGPASVPGALGKFVKEISKKYKNHDIVTYADLRYGTGAVYNNNKFTETHVTSPGYWYYVNGRMYHRLSWTKKKLVAMGFDSNKTEEVLMREIGAIKIFDCGHKHFILRNADE